MSRRTVNGIKLNRPITEAERQAIRRAGDMDKQFEKARQMNLIDEDWARKTLRILRYISRDII